MTAYGLVVVLDAGAAGLDGALDVGVVVTVGVAVRVTAGAVRMTVGVVITMTGVTVRVTVGAVARVRLGAAPAECARSTGISSVGAAGAPV